MGTMSGNLAVAATLFGTLLGSNANAGEVLDRILSMKTLTVAVSPNCPPSSFLNEKGELVGFDVDVAKHVADHLGVAVKYETSATRPAGWSWRVVPCRVVGQDGLEGLGTQSVHPGGGLDLRDGQFGRLGHR
ncbi:transporter substrate-binding domain-containing protein [Mesorhizobium sp.]|uniref:transporter substrate-binding domain-containing protein n=1 Tax=Mesorhizobium sp. TaxID=1871066 RepID=UPI0025C55A94|nr:transporter substrate-binding domain-containing protein [Mesorhizobium sp.]